MYVTHDELGEAIADLKDDIAATERRLRSEFTDAVRYEVGRVDEHLSNQDERINWVLGLIVALLITVIGALVYVALG